MINWNVESKHVLAFQAFFHAEGWRGKACSVLINWAENVSNPCISYKPLNKIVEKHPFLKCILPKIKEVVNNSLLFGEEYHKEVY